MSSWYSHWQHQSCGHGRLHPSTANMYPHPHSWTLQLRDAHTLFILYHWTLTMLLFSSSLKYVGLLYPTQDLLVHVVWNYIYIYFLNFGHKWTYSPLWVLTKSGNQIWVELTSSLLKSRILYTINLKIYSEPYWSYIIIFL